MFLTDLRGFRLNFAIALAGACAWILQGYDQAVMNGLLTMATFDHRFPQLNTNRPGVNKEHASVIEGTIVAIYELGCTAGCLSCYFIGDKFGRRKIIMGCCCLTVIGVIIQCSSYKIEQLAIGRVITGCGVGALTATVPMWISECSSAKMRGRMVSLCGAMAIVGVCLATWVDFGFYFVKKSEVNWRFPVALQLVFPIVCLLGVTFLPDSPRWLVKKGRVEEAAEIFARLEDTTVDSDHVQGEIAIIEQSLQESKEDSRASPFSFTKNKHFRRTLMAIGVNLGAQMTGVNVVTFYSTTIFQDQLGYSAVISRIFSGSLQIWQLLSAILSIWMIDYFGRRALMIHSAFLMCLSQFCLGGLASDLANKSSGKAMIFFFFLALYAYPTGLLLIAFIYAAEIAPLECRAQITAISSASNWLFNFLVAEASPVAFDRIGFKYYFLYGSCALCLLVALILFYPETKGRSLEEIDDIFINSKGPLDAVSIAKKLPYAGDGDLPVESMNWSEKPDVNFVETAEEKHEIEA